MVSTVFSQGTKTEEKYLVKDCGAGGLKRNDAGETVEDIQVKVITALPRPTTDDDDDDDDEDYGQVGDIILRKLIPDNKGRTTIRQAIDEYNYNGTINVFHKSAKYEPHHNHLLLVLRKRDRTDNYEKKKKESEDVGTDGFSVKELIIIILESIPVDEEAELDENQSRIMELMAHKDKGLTIQNYWSNRRQYIMDSIKNPDDKEEEELANKVYKEHESILIYKEAWEAALRTLEDKVNEVEIKTDLAYDWTDKIENNHLFKEFCQSCIREIYTALKKSGKNPKKKALAMKELETKYGSFIVEKYHDEVKDAEKWAAEAKAEDAEKKSKKRKSTSKEGGSKKKVVKTRSKKS